MRLMKQNVCEMIEPKMKLFYDQAISATKKS